jgi:hypothetical protein
MKNTIAIITGILVVIGMCFGTYFWIDNRYAHAGDMYKVMKAIEKIETRLDCKIIEDQLRAIQQRIWTIEDRYCTNKSESCSNGKIPQTVREEYKESKNTKEKLQRDLKVLQEKNKAESTHGSEESK